VEFSAVETNLRDSFRVLARNSRSGEVREYNGVSIASAGVTFQMFNAAFLSAPVEMDQELEARIEQSAVHFGARGQDWACWVCESFIPEGLRKRARALFRDRRMHLSVELPGMIAEEIAPLRHALPALEIRRVGCGPTRDDFCCLGSTCFNVPLPWFREVFSGVDVWRDFASYVGYYKGEPVSTAATVIGAGAIGVYNVGTLPGYQRRGFGEAIMRHALEEARREHGISRTILQSSPQGLRLYQRMGYRTVTKVVVYSS
jgi:ribosomal protein S18 acetylase RimI-like enzyme